RAPVAPLLAQWRPHGCGGVVVLDPDVGEELDVVEQREAGRVVRVHEREVGNEGGRAHRPGGGLLRRNRRQRGQGSVEAGGFRVTERGGAGVHLGDERGERAPEFYRFFQPLTAPEFGCERTRRTQQLPLILVFLRCDEVRGVVIPICYYLAVLSWRWVLDPVE